MAKAQRVGVTEDTRDVQLTLTNDEAVALRTALAYNVYTYDAPTDSGVRHLKNINSVLSSGASVKVNATKFAFKGILEHTSKY